MAYVGNVTEGCRGGIGVSGTGHPGGSVVAGGQRVVPPGRRGAAPFPRAPRVIHPHENGPHRSAARSVKFPPGPDPEHRPSRSAEVSPSPAVQASFLRSVRILAAKRIGRTGRTVLFTHIRDRSPGTPPSGRPIEDPTSEKLLVQPVSGEVAPPAPDSIGPEPDWTIGSRLPVTDRSNGRAPFVPRTGPRQHEHKSLHDNELHGHARERPGTRPGPLPMVSRDFIDPGDRNDTTPCSARGCGIIKTLYRDVAIRSPVLDRRRGSSGGAWDS
jgi:hypothetical protein